MIADCITYASGEQWQLGKERFGFDGDFREICEVFEQESFAIWVIEEPILFTKPTESVEVPRQFKNEVQHIEIYA